MFLVVMSDEFKHLSGKHKQRFVPTLNNPEVVKKTDWWDDVCKAHGEENHWKKKVTNKPKPKAKPNNNNNNNK